MSTERTTFTQVVDSVREQTALLLGSAIGLSDDDWARPTALSGWTRSHVAAHVAEGAMAMVRVIRGLRTSVAPRLYESDADKRRAIELGALASGLELQISLDTSASALQLELPQLEDDDRSVELRAGYRLQASMLPLARLSEVVLHHMDLNSSFDSTQLAPTIAVELLSFQVDRIGRSGDYPPLHLVADEGYTGTVGRVGDPTELHGPAGDLLAWLARGTESARIYRA